VVLFDSGPHLVPGTLSPLFHFLSVSAAPQIIATRNPNKQTSIFASILSLLLSGYDGILEVLLDLFGQLSLHILVTLFVTSCLNSPLHPSQAESGEEGARETGVEEGGGQEL
jgi:hypothetical protein